MVFWALDERKADYRSCTFPNFQNINRSFNVMSVRETFKFVTILQKLDREQLERNFTIKLFK